MGATVQENTRAICRADLINKLLTQCAEPDIYLSKSTNPTEARPVQTVRVFLFMRENQVMPNGESTLIQTFFNLLPAGVIAVIGGALDYLYAVKRGARKWDFAWFLLHLVFAFFTGYIVCLAVVGLGYDYSLAGAAAGAGGFINIRLFDLGVEIIKSRYQRQECEIKKEGSGHD